MGLDMYAYFGRTKEEVEDPDSNLEEDFYWRGRWALHNWFKNNAWAPEHPGEDLDCNAVELTKDIILKLKDKISTANEKLVPVYEDDVMIVYRKNFPVLSELYESVDDPKGTMEYDEEFIEKALKAIDEGKTVYYIASW